MKLLAWFVSTLIAVTFCHAAAWAQSSGGTLMSRIGPERRMALLIGNSKYTNPKLSLANPVNDVRLMARVLTAAGFEVDSLENGTRLQMHQTIKKFGDKLKMNKGIGLFFYAGHGMQIKGANFLIPVDGQTALESSATYDAVNVDSLLDWMAEANTTTNIIILDACRNNPFEGTDARPLASSRGLAQMNAPVGSYVVYAAGVGQTASDGAGANGLFTQHFAQAVQDMPGRKIQEVMMQVRTSVRRDSEGRQVPWETSALETDFYFYQPTAAVASAAIITPEPPRPTPVAEPVVVAAITPTVSPTILPAAAPSITMGTAASDPAIWRYNLQTSTGSASETLRLQSTQEGWQKWTNGNEVHTDGRVRAWRIGSVLLRGASEDGLWRFPLKESAMPPLSAEMIRADGKATPVRLFISGQLKGSAQMELVIRADAITEVLQYSAVFQNAETAPTSYQVEMKNRLTGAVSMKLAGQKSNL